MASSVASSPSPSDLISNALKSIARPSWLLLSMIPLSADETPPLSGASTKSMPSTAPARHSATLDTATTLPSLSVTAPAETSA